MEALNVCQTSTKEAPETFYSTLKSFFSKKANFSHEDLLPQKSVNSPFEQNPEAETVKAVEEKKDSSKSPSHQNIDENRKISQIRENIIGLNCQYESVFGITLSSLYVDHTATNRPYKKIERMLDKSKRLCANPHTQYNHYGKYSNKMMNYSQESLFKAFSADPKKYAILPVGSGATGAIEKAIKMIKSSENFKLKPEVFLTPYEHHSNILAWVEFYEKIHTLAGDSDGILDFDLIEKQLTNNSSETLIISVSATSNVTSQVTDLKRLNSIIKKIRKTKKVIFCVDCAAYCCHHELNLTACDEIDFAFISPHKNLGGNETCGLLVVNKNQYSNEKPSFPGGGTVAFVTAYNKDYIQYHSSFFRRETPGTPPFLGYYRAALSFQLLRDIGYDFIHQREKKNTEHFLSLIKLYNKKLETLNIEIVTYGCQDINQRANSITLNISVNGQMLQHHILSLIFSDIFGIQLRSGCFCSGPFAMRLLKMDDDAAKVLSESVLKGSNKERPGFLRLDLTFYLEEYEIEYLAEAIYQTARNHRQIFTAYKIEGCGKATRKPFLFNTTPSQQFSLSSTSDEVDTEVFEPNGRLSSRREAFSEQMETAKFILKDPIAFLQSKKKKTQQ